MAEEVTLIDKAQQKILSTKKPSKSSNLEQGSLRNQYGSEILMEHTINQGALRASSTS
jgi:hypothetical protein